MEKDSGGQRERTALLLLGCPEVPVQMGIALYLAGRLEKDGIRVTVAGNPSVIQLARVSDPDQHYVKRVMNLEKAMADLIEGRIHPDITVTFRGGKGQIFVQKIVATVVRSDGQVITKELDRPENGQISVGEFMTFQGTTGVDRVIVVVTILGKDYKVMDMLDDYNLHP